jgi:hypothetical protein
MPDDAAELGFKGGKLSSAAQPSRGDYRAVIVATLPLKTADRSLKSLRITSATR